MKSHRLRAAVIAYLAVLALLGPIVWRALATVKPPGALAMPDYQKIFVDDYAYFDGSGSYDPQGYTLTTYSLPAPLTRPGGWTCHAHGAAHGAKACSGTSSAVQRSRCTRLDSPVGPAPPRPQVLS